MSLTIHQKLGSRRVYGFNEGECAIIHSPVEVCRCCKTQSCHIITRTGVGKTHCSGTMSDCNQIVSIFVNLIPSGAS